MKKLLFLLFGVGFSLVGCNQEASINERNDMQEVSAQNESVEINSLTVYERKNEDYIIIKEVVEPSEIEKAITIVENADWEENIKVQMESPPDYRFQLGAITYGTWVSTTKDSVELVPEGQFKYTKLSMEDSKELYQIITGKV